VVVAILRKELNYSDYVKSIANAGEVYISAVNLLECYLVLAAQSERVAVFIAKSGARVKEFSQVTAEIARQAFLQYGKGRHPAALNICDCAAYATARQLSMPLLFKGQDFTRTDIEPAEA
jgi:ribonuclease VapC